MRESYGGYDRYDRYEDEYEDDYRPRRRWSDDREDREDWRPWRPPEEPRQSGWGVASFVMGLLCGGGGVLLVVVAAALTADNGGDLDESSPEAVLLGLGLFACFIGSLMGGVFGLAGVLQPNRKKVFAIIGLAFNSLALMALLGLLVVGLVMG